VRSGTARHVVASEPTSAGRCGLKLQLTWQGVDARPASCLDLELVCGDTRSSGYRHGGRPNLTWEVSVKRNLKDWCITKELTLDR
jgi:hypothetical protein